MTPVVSVTNFSQKSEYVLYFLFPIGKVWNYIWLLGPTMVCGESQHACDLHNPLT